VGGEEEQLGDGEGCPRLGLVDKDARVEVDVGGLRMTVREGPDSHACLGVNPLDEPDELGGVGQTLGMGDPGLPGPTGHVSSDGKDVVDPRLGIVSDHLLEVGHRLDDTGEVTDGSQPRRDHVLGAAEGAITS